MHVCNADILIANDADAERKNGILWGKFPEYENFE